MRAYAAAAAAGAGAAILCVWVVDCTTRPHWHDVLTVTITVQLHAIAASRAWLGWMPALAVPEALVSMM